MTKSELEAIGDWSVFKGNEYHYAIALHALLYESVRQVTFFEGNDLRLVDQDGTDIWVQAKSGDFPWTVGELLKENLFRNYLDNALSSSAAGRPWRVRLATPAPIRRKDILDFIANPAKTPTLFATFTIILTAARSTHSDCAEETLRSTALTILTQIAETEPLSLRTLQAEIQVSLLKRFADSNTATQVLAALQLALVAATGLTSQGQSEVIDLAYLERATGWSLKEVPLLDHNVTEACDAQVRQTPGANWSSAVCIPRPTATALLNDFLRSDKSLFVLAGDSGSGKSWLCRDWADRVFAGRPRVFQSGYRLLETSSLRAIAGTAMQSFARSGEDSGEIWRRLTGAGRHPQLGPFVMLFDDLPLPGDADRFIEAFALYCAEARRDRVKLVLAVRSAVWRRISQLDQIRDHVYVVRTETGATNAYSHELSALSREEERALLVARFPEDTDRVNQIQKWLRIHGQNLRGNPYRFSLLVEQLEALGFMPESAGNLETLFQSEIETRIGNVARRATAERSEVEEAFETITESYFHNRNTGIRRSEAIRSLEEIAPAKGRTIYDALIIEGILTDSGDKDRQAGCAVFANPQLGDFLVAQQLTVNRRKTPVMAGSHDGLNDAPLDVASLNLVPGQDDGILTALTRGGAAGTFEKTLDWADALRRQNGLWLPALCVGLLQHPNIKVERLCPVLTAWANQRQFLEGQRSSMQTLGSLCAVSRFTRRWVARLYVDEESRHSRVGEFALGYALDSVPQWAIRVVESRLRRDLARSGRIGSDNEARFTYVDNAIRPFQLIETEDAVSYVEPVIGRLKDWNTRNKGQNSDEALDGALAAIRGRLAVHWRDDSAQFTAVVQDFSSPDWATRFHAARALRIVTHQQPHRVRQIVFRAATPEFAMVPMLELLWPYIDSDPDSVMEVLETLALTDKVGVGSTLSLLAAMASRKPDRARLLLEQCLPDLNGADGRQVHANSLAFAWWMYASANPTDTVARERLHDLSEYPVDSQEAPWKCFAEFTRVIALLGLISVDLPSISATARTSVHQYYHESCFESGQDFLWLNLVDAVRPHAADIVMHSLFPRLSGALTDTIRQRHGNGNDAADVVAKWRFRVCHIAKDILADLACYVPDIQVFLSSLKPLNSWDRLHILNRLCETKGVSALPEALWEVGIAECRKLNGQMLGTERDTFLAFLSTSGRLPPELKSDFGLPAAFDMNQAFRFDQETRLQPSRLLQRLHSELTPENAVSMLFNWGSESDDPATMALSTAYRRMLSNYPVSPAEYTDLCRTVICAIDTMSAPAPISEHRLVYTTLLTFQNQRVPSGRISATRQASDDWVGKSHAEAAELLATEAERELALLMLSAAGRESVFAELESVTIDGTHRINNGNVSYGMGGSTPTVYALPATRLALAAIERRSRRNESFALVEARLHEIYGYWYRHDIIRLFNESDFVRFTRAQRHQALRRLIQQARDYKETALVQSMLAEALLRQGRITASRIVLRWATQLSDFPRGTLDHDLYSLACVAARLGDREECRSALMRINKWPVSREHFENDVDLVPVRGAPWFQLMIETKFAPDQIPQGKDLES